MEILLRERSVRIIRLLGLDGLLEEKPEVFVKIWEYLLDLSPGRRRVAGFMGIVGSILHTLCPEDHVDVVIRQVRDEWPCLSEREIERVMTDAIKYWLLQILLERCVFPEFAVNHETFPIQTRNVSVEEARIAFDRFVENLRVLIEPSLEKESGNSS